MPKKTSRGRYNWARPAALRGGRPLVDAGFPRDEDEVVIIGRRRDVIFGVGTAWVASGVRSKFKIYKRIVRPKRYTQTHKSDTAVLVVAH
jgi:hypothetical protein